MEELMTLEEAIEILNLFLKNEWPGPIWKFDKALQIGIKALERFKLYRYKPDPNAWRLLPGETED